MRRSRLLALAEMYLVHCSDVVEFQCGWTQTRIVNWLAFSAALYVWFAEDV